MNVWAKLKRLLRGQALDGNDESLYLKTVGWGPFPLPGERKRQQRAHAAAVRLMEQAEAVDKRS